MSTIELAAIIVKDVSRLKAADARAAVAQRLDTFAEEVRAEIPAPTPVVESAKPAEPDPALVAAKDEVERGKRHLSETKELLTTAHREAEGLVMAKKAAEAELLTVRAKLDELSRYQASLQGQEQLTARVNQLEAELTNLRDFERFVQSFGDYRQAYQRRKAPANELRGQSRPR